ncbi:DNA polymerase III subunit delta' [Gorillibacterium massiliense]|uniref:DNA polymerase III subunit delta' n=1 Tax=Gorillibacterium massiliense TaxID=1280390 RepID=UPI0004B346B3|nr:DNA polymerase III subunit delta' [Gorillibacterium massiliense]
MPFQDISGQHLAKRILQNHLRSKTLSHAYIFSGPKGSGRKQTAMTLVQAIYCQERTDDACGECVECRRVAHGNHPDVRWIEPDGASVKIEQVRELQKDLSYRASASQKKIYIIDEAEKMTVQAANSLLKFLEEPGSDIMAVLLTENGQALLPTIRSRAQWISFVPAPPKTMADTLLQEGIPAPLALPAVHLVAGIAAARELSQAEWFAEARSVMLQLARESLSRKTVAAITAQQKLLKGTLAEHLGTVLDLWILWFKDMVQIQFGRNDDVVYIDQLDWMSKTALTKEPGFWVAGMEQVMEVQKRIRFNANPQLSLENLIFGIQGG